MSRNQTLLLFFLVAALAGLVFGKIGKTVNAVSDSTVRTFEGK